MILAFLVPTRLNLTQSQDGAVSASTSAIDTAGNHANRAGSSTVLDTTADLGG